MPYIKKEDRVKFKLDELADIENTGEFNYVISVLAAKYLKKHGVSYKTCSEITAAMDNAKDEFTRRIMHVYEDKKILENGDVYGEVMEINPNLFN